MNEVQVFNFEQSNVRTVMIDNEPYFVGKDVAEVLGYSNTQKAIRDHVDVDDKLTERIVLSGQNREVVVINESGVYSLIFGSKLDSAKRFKKWVTSEVLPSIRKTGGYQKNNQSIGIEALKNIIVEFDKQGERIGALEEFKEDYELNRPIDGNMPLQLEKARKRRVMEIVGGKGTKAYGEFYTDILRNKVFRDYSDRFMVARYRDTKVKDYQEALEFLENWEPSKETRYAIEYSNMQLELDL